jgi:hypothetical protein
MKSRTRSTRAAAVFLAVCTITAAAIALTGCADTAAPPGQPSFYQDLATSGVTVDAAAAASMVSG